MSKKGVITETADQNIYAACRMMHENNIGCIIIVDRDSAGQKKPVGLFQKGMLYTCWEH
jgi:predicted transcriptional regulator